MSRLPRHLEYLKTGFTAEALSAARFRANAAQADRDGWPDLAQSWRELAAEKDRLAIAQLEAAGQIRGELEDLEAALADERYENDLLYPKLLRAVDGPTAEAFERVVAAQRQHLERLIEMRDRFKSAKAEAKAPAA